jgi:hypothetical protein
MWWLLRMTVIMVAMWSREEEKEEREWGVMHFQEDIVAWGSIQTTTDCFPHPYWMYEKCLSTFMCCG